MTITLTNPFETENITSLTRCHVRSRRDSPLGPVRILTRLPVALSHMREREREREEYKYMYANVYS